MGNLQLLFPENLIKFNSKANQERVSFDMTPGVSLLANIKDFDTSRDDFNPVSSPEHFCGDFDKQLSYLQL